MRLLPLPGVFQPHSDSRILAAHLRSEPLPLAARVLDLCTGSGLLAVTAAQLGAPTVIAVDVSRRAVLAAGLNAALNGVTVRAVHGDLFGPVHRTRFDLIVSNPPYLPSAAGEVPSGGAARAWEGGFDGRAFIDRICAQAYEHLRPGGVLLLVQSSVCGEHATIAELSRGGLQTSVVGRHRGELGPRLRSRAGWLQQRGLLTDGHVEELLVIRGRKGGKRSS